VNTPSRARRGRPTLALLKLNDYQAWQSRYDRGLQPGDIGPYGMRGLEQAGFELRYTDAARRMPWCAPLIARPLRKIAHLRPEFSGLLAALTTVPLVARSDATLAVFEDQGLGAATAKARGLPPFANHALAIVSCWLAETWKELDGRSLAAVRRALAAVDTLLFFSSNQARIFERELGVDPACLACVPFGIDHRFFKPLAKPVEQNGCILAVGRDRSRDHSLLVEAVRGTGMRLMLVGPALDAPEKMPEEVDVISHLDHIAYRRALAQAAVVAVPTTAPAYPSGQTVVLEAMAMCKAVVTTDSPAMREYVTAGVTGELVPSGDAGALARTLRHLLDAPDRRMRLGQAGRESVERRFNDVAMWGAVAEHLRPLMDPSGRSGC
jgi:glycosyltransferase involved in cell wall biosynthesis